MERIAVACILSGAAGRAVDALRKQYDPQSAAAIPAHVTLAGPVDVESALGVDALIASCLVGQAAFPVRVGGVATFLPSSATCYLRIGPVRQLTALHDLLISVLGWQEQWPYAPHVTITEYLSHEETSLVAEHLRHLTFCECDRVSSVTLLRKQPDGVWLPMNEFPLQAV